MPNPVARNAIIVPKRRLHYGPTNPLEAREIFIHRALAAGEFDTHGEFFRHNRKLVSELRELENKARRRDVLVDEHTGYEFYDASVASPGACRRRNSRRS